VANPPEILFTCVTEKRSKDHETFVLMVGADKGGVRQDDGSRTCSTIFAAKNALGAPSTPNTRAARCNAFIPPSPKCRYHTAADQMKMIDNAATSEIKVSLIDNPLLPSGRIRGNVEPGRLLRLSSRRINFGLFHVGRSSVACSTRSVSAALHKNQHISS